MTWIERINEIGGFTAVGLIGFRSRFSLSFIPDPSRTCEGGVAAFMRGTQLLGEPFRFGFDSVERLLEEAGLWCEEVTPSKACLAESSDPIFGLYYFACASAARIPIQEFGDGANEPLLTQHAVT